MRINPNLQAQVTSEDLQRSERNRHEAVQSSEVLSSPPSSSVVPDRASISVDHAKIAGLVAQALAYPEIRQERVSSLRQSINSGRYQPDVPKIARAFLSEVSGVSNQLDREPTS